MVDTKDKKKSTLPEEKKLHQPIEMKMKYEKVGAALQAFEDKVEGVRKAE